MAKPILEVLKAWVQAHLPAEGDTEFDAGYRALAARLLAELDGSANLPE
jgi:hypothetical protein